MTDKHDQKCKHANACDGYTAEDCNGPNVAGCFVEPVKPEPQLWICPDAPMVLTVSQGISHDGTKWEWELDFEPSCDSAPSKYVPLADYEQLRDRLELAEQIGRLEDTMADSAIPEFFERAVGRQYRGQDGGDLCVNDIRALLMLFWNQRAHDFSQPAPEQPAPTPDAPLVDVDVIRRRYVGVWDAGRGPRESALILAMCCEIDRLRDRLELAEQRDEQSNKRLCIMTEERDEARNEIETLRSGLAKSSRLTRSYIGLWRRTLAERDKSHADSRVLRTENKRLRHELEAMTIANEQLGGLVREAQAGTVFVGGEE